MAGAKKKLIIRTVLRYHSTAMKKRAESREGMIITTLALSPELHRRLAIAAVEENAAINEVVRQAVTDWLARRERQKRRKS